MHPRLKLSYINMAIRPHTDAQSIKKNKQIKVHLRGKVKLVTVITLCVFVYCTRVDRVFCIMYKELF